MATTVERLWEMARSLPEPLLAEVLDFAEFLHLRRARAHDGGRGVNLSELCGGLETSSTFSDSPEAIQQRLRDEWH